MFFLNILYIRFIYYMTFRLLIAVTLSHEHGSKC